MDKKQNIQQWLRGVAFILWSLIVLSAFYITQHPLVFQVIKGISATLWSLTLIVILLFNSAGLGYFILTTIQPQLLSDERLILGTGCGLGMFGLIGYGLGAAGWASPVMLLIVLCAFTLLILIFKIHSIIWQDFRELINSFEQNRRVVPVWLPLAVLATAFVGILFALLPPAEGFDGLFYHLRLPELLLSDDRILPYNILQFWFPGLLEGDFLWSLGLGSEQGAQLIHWSFSILMFALIWGWSHQIFGYKSAWWSLAIVISMPSLPWLSGWAYTDMALTFFCLASLYSLWHWYDAREKRWLLISGLFSGMAMGIKYTSFILPISCVLLIFFRERNLKAAIHSSIKYSLPALLIAMPWYLRNWIFMDNPFYPFVFGGRYWDSFQSAHYSGSGTGIGWVFHEILLLPFTLTLGYHDQNYFDGRLGPLFLLLLPLVPWIFWIKRSAALKERSAILIISTFTLLNYCLWVFSVI